jgi:hypothetical protein
MLTRALPVLVAVMVWMIRVLIIGTFSLAGENMFTMADDRPASRLPSYRTERPAEQRPVAPRAPATSPVYARPAPKPASTAPRPLARPEPTYHPVGMSADPFDDDHPVRH